MNPARATGLMMLLISSTAFGQADRACSNSGTLAADSVFIGYTRPGETQLKTLALFVSSKLQPYDGRNLQVGLALIEVASTSLTESRITSLSPYLNTLGRDHCVFSAEISAPPSNSWRLWVSGPPSESSLSPRPPRPAEQDAFKKLKPDCVSQGDPPPGQEHCAHAELLAVSDMDANGLAEYWHTTPYLWDTGLSVSELSASNELSIIVSACPGCSD